MRIKFSYISSLIVVLSVMACQREAVISDSGKLSFVLTDGVAALTRSLPDLSAEAAGQFTLQLRSVNEDRLVFDNTLSAFDASAPHLFAAGDYTVFASHGANPDLAMDAPYYASEAVAFTLEAGKEKELLLPCFVANSLASFKFGNQDKLEKVLKDYYIEVVVGNQSVEWRPGDIENPYFKAGSTVDLYLKGIWVENNKEYSHNFATIKPSQMGKNYVYTLKIDTSNMAGAIFDLQVEASVETVTVNETIPPEWLPKPKINAVGFDDSNTLIYVETADAATAQIAYKAVLPAEDVEFTLNFEDEHLSSLNKTYLLSTLTAEERSALEAMNISLPVLNSTEGRLDLSAMTSRLLAKNIGEVNNRITMKVKANGRWSEEKTFTVRAVKPKFAVSVYPGNIWTKEFTVNMLTATDVMAGSVDKIVTDLQYQFSADGDLWTLLDSDMRKNELTPGSTYYVRALYRGELVSDVTEVRTYLQRALTNGNLSEYSIVRGQDGKATGSYGAQYEWTGWSTLNSTTAGKCTSTAYAYNSRSGTRPVSDVRSGSSDRTAVWIVTIGYGYGGTNSEPNSKMPSELSVNLIDDNVSHPTGLHFWYKYAPYAGDKSDIRIEVYSGEQVIGSGALQTEERVSDYTQARINIEYGENSKMLRPTRIYILMKSGFNQSVEKRESSSGWELVTANMANPMFRGSELYIDDVELIYDK